MRRAAPDTRVGTRQVVDGAGQADPIEPLPASNSSPVGRGRQLSKTIARDGRVDLLCLDELGYVQLDRRGAELLFRVLTEGPGRRLTGAGSGRHSGANSSRDGQQQSGGHRGCLSGCCSGLGWGAG